MYRFTRKKTRINDAKKMCSIWRKFIAERHLKQLVISRPSADTTSATYNQDPSKSETWLSASSNHEKG